MRPKTLDHKAIEVVENLPVECIEIAYLSGRKAFVCEHVVDGVLPRAIQTKATARFSIQVRGDVENGIEYTVYPTVFVCADCLADLLADIGADSGPDLSADHPRGG